MFSQACVCPRGGGGGWGYPVSGPQSLPWSLVPGRSLGGGGNHGPVIGPIKSPVWGRGLPQSCHWFCWGWGGRGRYPQLGQGLPPDRRGSSSYAAGSMPLAGTQEDLLVLSLFLLFYFLNTNWGSPAPFPPHPPSPQTGKFTPPSPSRPPPPQAG